MKTCLLLLIVLGLLTACGNPTDQSGTHAGHSPAATTAATGSAALEKTVMATHDSLMTQMTDLARARGAVRLRLVQVDSLAKADPNPNRATQRTALEARLEELQLADDAMMDWMAAYDHEMRGKTEEQKMAYLTGEKKKVEAVRQKIADALARNQRPLP